MSWEMTRCSEPFSGWRSQEQSPSNHIKELDHRGTCFQQEAAFPEAGFPEPFLQFQWLWWSHSLVAAHGLSRSCHSCQSQPRKPVPQSCFLAPMKAGPLGLREQWLEKPFYKSQVLWALLMERRAADTKVSSSSSVVWNLQTWVSLTRLKSFLEV